MVKLEQVTREELTKKSKGFFSFGRVCALAEGKREGGREECEEEGV